MTMNGNIMDQALDVARRVLETDDLRSGPQRVQSLNTEVQRFIGKDNTLLRGVWFFRVVTDSIWSTEQELVVLFQPSAVAHADRMRLVRRVAEDVPNCKSITCVGKEEIKGSRNGRAEGVEMPCTLRWLQPLELFQKMFHLPDNFAAQLRDSAGIQRAGEFPLVFQNRRGHVHVVAGQQPRETDVDLTEYFQTWLGAHARRSPILLLGERGTGKSWQLLHFVEVAYKLHKESPWKFGPAFFVKLRDLVNTIEQSSGATSILSQYIFQKHPDIRSKFSGSAMLGALLEAGHTVVCVDGFDEMDQFPSDTQVQSRLMTLLLLLSKRTRFIMSSRAGHFSSLVGLLNMEAWYGASIGDTFEVLRLTPFDDERKVRYIHSAGVAKPGAIASLLGLSKDVDNPLKRALSISASHPGMLANLKDELNKGVSAPLELVSNAIWALIDSNISEARTRERYRTESGTWVDLSTPRRVELLSDLAWYMAERRLDAVNLIHLPPRFRLTYNIDDDALRRDLRSQTVLEVFDPSARQDELETKEENAQREVRSQSLAGGKAPLAVARGEEAYSSSIGSSGPVRFTLRDSEPRDEGVGESSVAGACFLSWYLADRLTDSGPFGEMPEQVRFRALGRVRLGPMTGAMLQEWLIARGCSLRELGVAGWRLIRELAIEGGFRTYIPWYRHLARNLAAIGSLTREESAVLDPWTALTAPIVHPPERLPDYEMVLVPSPRSSSGDARPYLLGVHEVTNQHYLDFITAPSEPNTDCSVIGNEWSVRRMTLAGSGRRNSRSKNHVLSNEYHLFPWLQTHAPSPGVTMDTDKNGPAEVNYEPPANILRHPVTYVSWYAAAAFCDWLSLKEEILSRCYEVDLQHALAPTDCELYRTSRLRESGYRLATSEEWHWAARGGHEDILRPWEMFPYYLPRKLRQPSSGDGVADEDASNRYEQAQHVMRKILLDTGKQAVDVLYDELNDFGLSGMMGNVREWCDDQPEDEDSSKGRLVLGATGSLGESTFNFEYSTPLYPENTNPDVGFRVARSLLSGELDSLRLRQVEIASLPEDPPGRITEKN